MLPDFLDSEVEKPLFEPKDKDGQPPAAHEGDVAQQHPVGGANDIRD